MYLNNFEIDTTASKDVLTVSGTGETVLDTVTLNSTYYRGIYANASGNTITIKDSDIIVEYSSSSTTYGIYANTGTLIILNSTIRAKNTYRSSYDAYGIYIGTADVTLGVNDGEEVSQAMPYVEGISATGKGYGVNIGNGSFRFYDGKILGSTNARLGTITSVPYLYEAHSYPVEATEESAAYEYCVLDPQ